MYHSTVLQITRQEDNINRYIFCHSVAGDQAKGMIRSVSGLDKIPFDQCDCTSLPGASAHIM